MATFPTKKNPLSLALAELSISEKDLASAVFPISKTVHLDKDIGVVSNLAYIGTSSRMRLSTILLSIDAALTSLREDAEWSFEAEQENRIAAVQDIQNQLNQEIINRVTDVNAEETRAITAETLEISTRIQNDGYIRSAIDSDRSPLKILYSTGVTYTINSGTVSQVNNVNGQILNEISVASGVYQTDFSGCTLNFSNKTITYSSGPLGAPSNGTITVPSLVGQNNKWIKASVVLLPTAPDIISINFASSFANTKDLALAPTVTGGVPIGIISFQVNSSGTGFVNGSQQFITQFKDMSPEDSSGSSESPLDPSIDQSFLYYTRSDFSVDRKNFVESTTGTDQILGLGKIILNSGQQIVSKDLTGSMIRSDAAIVNCAQVNLLYANGKIDNSPIVEMTVDGGTNWSNNRNIAASQGNHLVIDFNFPQSQNIFSGGTAGTQILSGQRLAAVIRPSYRSVVTSFQAYLSSSGDAGTVIGKIYKVSNGTPITLVASASESYVLGQDIGQTPSYKFFTFAPVTLDANVEYALVVEGTGLNSNLNWLQATSPTATSVSSATHNGSGWSGNLSKLAFSVYGTGLDVRIKITSSTNSSELLGFGVNMVLDNQAGYAGEKSWELRAITSTEAQTGLITLSSCRYTVGAHQLHANVGGHDFMAPDFVELSGSLVQFPENFLQEGDVVKFYVGYGIVEGSSVALQKINSIYEAVVGNSSQVASGSATYSSIQTAINAVAAGGKITILQGSFTENLTINKEICIHGKGRSSIINGTINFGNGSSGSMLKFTKITGNVTIDLLTEAINISDNWISSGKNVTGGTNCFILNIGEI